MALILEGLMSMSRLRNFLIFICLILSHFGFAETTANRGVLFQEAFKGLPFYVYAAAGRIDNNFYSTFKVANFSEKENELLRQLLMLLIHHGEDFTLDYVTEPTQQWIFDLQDGQEERTAVTDSNIHSRISLNMKRINNPETQLDFIDAIQLLLHEVSKKIPHIDQVIFDGLAAKLSENLRSSYATFKVHDNRFVHVLTIDRPDQSISTDAALMKTFWLDRQGFEITTFDETNGYFRHVEELRHSFANPGLVTSIGSNNVREALTRNSILGVEVDHFRDQTTIIRIVADQVQTLVGGYLGPVPLGDNQTLREYVIRLHGNEKPQITKRQGYVVKNSDAAKLKAFELANSTIKGSGVLPFPLKALKDINLYLLVRASNGLLNIPLKIVSTDPEAPAEFIFERKIDLSVKALQIIATDILINDGTMTPLNRISLAQTVSLEVPASKELINKFNLTKAQAKSVQGWSSIRNKDAKVELGDVPFRFVFQSESFIQEMTLYIQHSRQVYDPNKLKDKVRNNIAGQERMGVRPSPFDSSIAEEIEVEVIRIDASQMKQKFVNGHLEVVFTIHLKESASRVHTDGPYYTMSGFGFRGYQQTIEHKISYGVDDEGKKEFSKIVVVNQNFQKISIEGPQLGIQLHGKKGNYMTPEIWKRFNSQFIDMETDSCEAKFK